MVFGISGNVNNACVPATLNIRIPNLSTLDASLICNGFPRAILTCNEGAMDWTDDFENDSCEHYRNKFPANIIKLLGAMIKVERKSMSPLSLQKVSETKWRFVLHCY